MKKIFVPIIAVVVLFMILALLGKGITKSTKQAVSPTSTVSETPTPEVTGAVQPETTTGTSESTTLALEISSPQNGATVSTSTITVTGKTAPNIQVFVNEKELVANGNGDFSTDIELFEGENSIFVVANNNVGDYVERELTVTLESN